MYSVQLLCAPIDAIYPNFLAACVLDFITRKVWMLKYIQIDMKFRQRTSSHYLAINQTPRTYCRWDLNRFSCESPKTAPILIGSLIIIYPNVLLHCNTLALPLVLSWRKSKMIWMNDHETDVYTLCRKRVCDTLYYRTKWSSTIQSEMT